MEFFASLFRREHGNDAPSDPRRIEMVQRVLRLSPRLRIAPRYWARLEASVGEGIDYVRGLVATLPEAREASAASWAGDPCIRAFFGAPEELSRLVNRTPEMRALFDNEPLLQSVFAVLGASCTEQTTVTLSDHKLRICAATPAALTDEILRNMVDQLLLETLAHIASDTSRRGVLERERVLLATRLRLLEREGIGMSAVIGGDVADASETARLREQLKQNDSELDSLGAREELLEHELDAVCEVFADPLPWLHVTPRRLWLGPARVLTADASDGEAVDLHVARVPGVPPQMRAFTLVRLPRAHLDARA